jgi:hypothetical protein
MVHNHLSGLHFIERRLIATSCRHFLKNELLLHLEDVPFGTKRRMWIQEEEEEEEASPHFGREHTEYLNANYQEARSQ